MPKTKTNVSPQSPSDQSSYDRFFQKEFEISPYPKFDKTDKKSYNTQIVSPHEGANEEYLPNREIRDRFHAFIDSLGDEFLANAFEAAKASEFALPIVAPALWEDRDRNKREKCVDFVRNEYGQWIGAGLRRAHLQKLDPVLYRTLSTFYSRNGIPSDLAVLETDHGKITPETLETLGIKEPKDALSIFKDDGVVARRYYQAARRLQGMSP